MTQPTCPQLVSATDISHPPGVIMWRNGETAAIASIAAMSSERTLARKAAQENSPRAQSDAGSAALSFIERE